MKITERFRPYEIKDAPGKGSFHITIREGFHPPQNYKVPVINFETIFKKGETELTDFFNTSLADESLPPIIAARNGEQDICLFVIKKSLFSSLKVIRHYIVDDLSKMESGANKWQESEIEPSMSYFVVWCSRANTPKGKFQGDYTEIIGNTINGDPFHAWVYFKPTRN
jgi:hypothetical protein